MFSLLFRYSAIFILTGAALSSYAQVYTIRGKVTGISIEPLAFISVNVQDQVNHATTNDKGEFQIKLANGKYTFVFTSTGYKPLKKDVIVNNADSYFNVIMEEDLQLLNEAEISEKYVDPARELIKHVIRNKEKYVQNSYQCILYIKAVANKNSKQSQKKINETQENTTDSTQVSKPKNKHKPLSAKDSITPKKTRMYDRFNMAEVLIKKSYEFPGKLKEDRIAFTPRGNTESLFYLSSTEGEFNFYQNRVYCPSLGKIAFQSPLSTAGLLLYKYKTIQVFTEDGKRIFRVRVEPTLIADALVSGEMEIIDSIYCVRKIDFIFPKYHLDEYTSFEFNADFVPYTDSLYRVSKMNFKYKIPGKENKTPGETTVYVDSFKYETKFPKKYFNDEVSTTLKNAYEKDTTFWQQVRKESLTEKELKFIRIEDSIKTAHLSKTYLDSIDKIENKITFPKIAFFGQTHYNRQKDLHLYFNPLWLIYQPVGTGGARLNYDAGIDKIFKNKKSIVWNTTVSYGILNKDLNGLLFVHRLYNPFQRAMWTLQAGKNYEIINKNDSWLNVFRTANYFLNKHISFYHSIELVNGLFWYSKAEYSTRKSISGIKNDILTSIIFDNYLYKPVDFSPYDALFVENALGYTLHQKYIRDAYQKIILGSNYPTLKVLYRKGIPGILNSAVNYDYLEFSLSQEIDLGFFGIAKYQLSTGEFYNKKSIKSVDNKYQPLIGFPFFANPLQTFQILEKSYLTNNRFYSGHYFHRFNGAIINKMPYVKYLRVSETAGGGFLYSKENKLFYFELFAGLEKNIRIFNEMFRVGVYFVNAKSSNYPFRSEFRLSIDHYDKRYNKWSY